MPWAVAFRLAWPRSESVRRLELQAFRVGLDGLPEGYIDRIQAAWQCLGAGAAQEKRPVGWLGT